MDADLLCNSSLRQHSFNPPPLLVFSFSQSKCHHKCDVPTHQFLGIFFHFLKIFVVAYIQMCCTIWN